jgi:hypothetical protein
MNKYQFNFEPGTYESDPLYWLANTNIYIQDASAYGEGFVVNIDDGEYISYTRCATLAFAKRYALLRAENTGRREA